TGDFFALTDAAYRVMHSSVSEALREVDRYKKDPDALVFGANVMTADYDGVPLMNGDRLTISDAIVRAASRLRSHASADPVVMLEPTAYWVNTGRPRAFSAPPSPDSAVVVNLWNTLAG